MAIALSAAYTATPAAALTKIVIEATHQVSAGVSFVNPSWFRQIHVSAAAAASPANILSGYNAKFGTLIAGKKIFFRAFAVGSTGLRSAPIVSSVVVT